MPRKRIEGKRLFVLDTNVLMHDPSALFKFSEHDVYLPMLVLEELDAAKKGLSEVSRNVRQVSRFIDELLQKSPNAKLQQGIPLNNMPFVKAPNGNQEELNVSGHLLIQTEDLNVKLPEGLPSSKPDNMILGVALNLRASHPHHQVTLVSKDINMRIKATALGLHAEDYFNDRISVDIEQLHTGYIKLPEDFWETHSNDMDSWQEEGKTYYKITGPLVKTWLPNQCLFSGSDEPFEYLVRTIEDGAAILEVAKDFRLKKNEVWGIHARNQEQSFALNLLMDSNIDFVTLQGPAGTGKTLLTLASALEQTIEQQKYSEVIMTRVTVPVGEDIGFLPGTEEEKMTPWMGALMDNLEVLSPSENTDQWGQVATQDVLNRWIKIRSLNFMRGRTFLNKFIIIDEAQNLTPKQMKTLITRAGPGTKIVCMGNIAQIDTPYLTESSSGITYVVDHFRNWNHSGHITLMTGERSRLADYASKNL
jgi:PhoH-like ATPase